MTKDKVCRTKPGPESTCSWEPHRVVGRRQLSSSSTAAWHRRKLKLKKEPRNHSSCRVGYLPSHCAHALLSCCVVSLFSLLALACGCAFDLTAAAVCLVGQGELGRKAWAGRPGPLPSGLPHLSLGCCLHFLCGCFWARAKGCSCPSCCTLVWCVF